LITKAFEDARQQLDSREAPGLTSNAALAVLRPSLEEIGFQVEAGKKTSDRIRKPVLFGDEGTEALAYEVDAFNEELGIAMEVEAGRGALGNADYRDLIQTSLLVDARFLVLAVVLEYHFKVGGKPRIARSYRDTHARLDAIYASERLALPLEGVLLVGY
jgi:hypothetical protein